MGLPLSLCCSPLTVLVDASPPGSLASHYRSFVEELCTLPDMGSRLEFLKRRGGGGRAGLAGVGMGYYRIPQAVARQLHGYTNQYDYKTTKLQNSTVSSPPPLFLLRTDPAAVSSPRR